VKAKAWLVMAERARVDNWYLFCVNQKRRRMPGLGLLLASPLDHRGEQRHTRSSAQQRLLPFLAVDVEFLFHPNNGREWSQRIWRNEVKKASIKPSLVIEVDVKHTNAPSLLITMIRAFPITIARREFSVSRRNLWVEIWNLAQIIRARLLTNWNEISNRARFALVLGWRKKAKEKRAKSGYSWALLSLPITVLSNWNRKT
jgi:hypothetical protein